MQLKNCYVVHWNTSQNVDKKYALCVYVELIIKADKLAEILSLNIVQCDKSKTTKVCYIWKVCAVSVCGHIKSYILSE